MILTFNGHEVPLEDCRISAMPFNRVWTGKQRNDPAENDQLEETYTS